MTTFCGRFLDDELKYKLENFYCHEVSEEFKERHGIRGFISFLDYMNNKPKDISYLLDFYIQTDLKILDVFDFTEVENADYAFRHSSYFPLQKFNKLKSAIGMFYDSNIDKFPSIDFSTVIDGTKMFANSKITELSDINFASLKVGTKMFHFSHINTVHNCYFPELMYADYMFYATTIRHLKPEQFPKLKYCKSFTNNATNLSEKFKNKILSIDPESISTSATKYYNY